MHLYIIRHGETRLNKEGLLQGQSDEPLSPEGEVQAEKAAAALQRLGISFDRAYASPLGRAVRTAEIVSGIPRHEILQDPRILEIGYGPYEGQPYMTLGKEMYDYFHDPSCTAVPKGVESIDALNERIEAFLEERRKDPFEGNILIAAHGMCMRAMMQYFEKSSFHESWGREIGNCDTYEVVRGTGTDWEKPRLIYTERSQA